jgi:indolepyruvate ferredoxin oxidoreductase, beta subunit
MERRRITIAILALGGQGGGVLADWLVALAERNGYFAQATSVPGVAQRTGSTVYYVEMFPERDIGGRQPVLALMPAPSDVDVVVASELMEAGRAILRGFVAREHTTLVTSTHRIYAIAEKSAPSGGLADGSKVLAAAARDAKALVAFDMDAEAQRTRSAISAVMFGALAGSGALPFAPERFEEAVRARGIAVDANLLGLRAGYDAAARGAPAASSVSPSPEPATGHALAARIQAELPVAAQAFAREGVRRLIDYQDLAYATLYLDRLAAFRDPEIAREMARALALWMSYEDVMRVAQQKVRASRLGKLRAEANAEPDQILHVTEYMHPRWQEVCDTMPARLGARFERGGLSKRMFSRRFEKGRHVRTTGVLWFAALALLAARRRARRGTLRYARENAQIEAWLACVREAVATDRDAALELAKCQALIKGYGETHAHGLRSFSDLMAAYDRLKAAPGAAAELRALREAALHAPSGP